MDTKDIKDLMDLIDGTDFIEVEVERGGERIRLRRKEAAAAGPDRSVAEAPAETARHEPGRKEEDSHFKVNSPFVGTFYRSASPNVDPFVEVGSEVKKGQALCIIEAMKLMNEIEAEADGVITRIAVETGQPVEYGQLLFLIDTGGPKD
jgi:acetyl-CoA carboxylase biotin carboxyl carrier protein